MSEAFGARLSRPLASAPALLAYVRRLLAAETLPDIADAAIEHARTAALCLRVQLVWTDEPGGVLHKFPMSPLDPMQRRLIDGARERGAPSQRELPAEGALEHAVPLDAEGETFLLAVRARGRALEPDPAWDDFLALLGARVSQAREAIRLRADLQRLGQAEQLQRALYAIADLASSEQDMATTLRGLHEIVGRLMYAENFFIVLFDAGRDSLRFIYFADTNDPVTPDPEEEIPAASIPHSLTLAMIRHGRAVMGPSTAIREQLGVDRDPALGPDSEDWLGVPMILGGEVRGAVVVQSYDPAVRYSEQDRALLSYVAQHILTALMRKRAQEELERRVEERTRELTQEVLERQRGERLQAALFRIAELSSTAESMEAFYAAVHGVVGGLLDARNFYIALLTEDGTELDFPYSVDERDRHRPRRKLAQGLTEHVLHNGHALLADRTEIERLERIGAVRSFGARSAYWLGVPLLRGDKTVGVIAVQSYTPEQSYGQRDLELLTFVSYHIATGLARKQAQESLRLAYAELEQRVDERTRELAQANRELREQISVRERMEHKLKHEALHDSLTGLPNRSFLLERLGQALARYRAEPNWPFAVLFLDLDRFKVVNDSVGHLVGDEMLKEAGVRLSRCVRTPDVVARLGGDEFAILVEDIRGVEDAVAVADRVIEAFIEPMRLAGKELFTSASIGIALVEPRYRRAEELLRDADVAMYRAKAQGRQRHAIFDQGLHEQALHLLDLEGDLRRAVQREEFVPYYQPIVRLADASVIGYEALLRWLHPERGCLLPADFLSVAEETGMVDAIDWLLFAHACHDVPALTGNGGYVSLNVSAQHFRAPDFAERLLATVAQAGAQPANVRVEVTEGVLLDNPDQIRAILERLRAAGVLTALDDFGTGYSSLSYLHRFPLQALKIDRSFVADLEPDLHEGSAAVVRAIRVLADTLGLEVIAEGIESAQQREVLRDLGVALGQGFLFAHPRPAGSFPP